MGTRSHALHGFLGARNTTDARVMRSPLDLQHILYQSIIQ